MSSPRTRSKLQTIEFNPNVYRLTAIKKAAYKYGDRFHIKIDIDQKDKIIVTIIPKKLADHLNDIIGDFCNEALDQDLRELVAEETEGIRNVLLTQAFSNISIINPEFDISSYKSDSFNITRRS